MLKIDMHVHTWYSDSDGSVDEVLEVARLKGLDGLAVTDHKTVAGAHEALRKRGKLIVIPGEEITTTQGEILALGIRKRIPERLPITDAILRIHMQGGLAIVPHPTVSFFSRLSKNPQNYLIDGLEVFSAITPLPGYFLRKNLELARRLRVGITAGSDSHSVETVGDAYTIVYSESRDLRDILQAVKLGNTSVGGGPSKLIFKFRMIERVFAHLFYG